MPYVALGLMLASLSLVFFGFMEWKMASAVDAMRAEIAQNTTVTQSAIALITGLAAKIRGMANDPGGLQQLADELDASNKSLADAVTANTPAADPAPVDTLTAGNGTDTLSGGDTTGGANGSDTLAGGDTASGVLGTDTLGSTGS